jgi:SNF2 family DNA or RNA helicase
MAQVYLDPAAGEDLASFLLTAETADRPALGASAQLPVDAVDVDGWLQQVFDQLRTQTLAGELAEPAGFVGELRPYQRRGVGWLAYLRRLGLGACLADDMGLGKTVQAIALLLARPLEKLAAVGPALLVCPTSLVANWRREVERFAPAFKTLVHHGSGRLAGTAFAEAVEASDLVITSYGTARRDIDLLRPLVWSDLILDEAQNIKNPGAKQSQAVRWLVAQNRVALTGTPVENHLNELWSVFEFLNPGYLGSHEAFRQRFLIPIERYNDEQRTQELRRLVQPFLLRRLKSDPSIISDLPEKNEMVVYCSLTSEQAALYEATVHAALATLDQADGIQRRGLVLALLTRLKQICNHPAQFLKEEEPLRQRSGKLERLTEMLEEALSVGDHALIFTQFVEMGTLLQRHLRGELQCEVLFLHGGISATQRDQMVQSFQSDDGPPIFVLSLRAGGFGLNLTRANHVFHFDRWWNPAVENQATDRAFRIGQRRNVQVHKFVVAGTLEERIHALLASKQSLAESIVGSGEAWLTELNTEELRELLMLRREVLDD